MTPTPEQLAAVLPRCSAGLDGGDWTDDDERLDWARRVLRYVEEANRRRWFISGTEAIRDPHDVRHGDTWEARDDRATIVASNDWPSPAKGTHATNHCGHWNDGRERCCQCGQWLTPKAEMMPWCPSVHDAEEAQ